MELISKTVYCIVLVAAVSKFNITNINSLLLLCFPLVMTVWATSTHSLCVLYREMGTLVHGVHGTGMDD